QKILAADWQGLEKLARELAVDKEPPSLLLLVALGLRATTGTARLDLLRRTQQAYPADFWANELLASELVGAGQPAEAVRYHTAALALRPNNPGVYLNRGVALKAARELDAAIADVHRAVALAPRYAAAHNTLGNAFLAKGELDDAIRAYHQALAIEPK